MDAIMFLELLEDEIKDMPTCALKSDARDVAVLGTAAASKSSKIDDKFKKPRISKDVWERRKSWAVEESGPTSSTPSTSPVKPRALKRVDEGGGGGAPPLPPRCGPSAESAHRPTDKRADDKTLSKSDVIKFDNPTTDRDKTTSATPAATPPALPPKKISAPSAPQFNSNWKSSGDKSKNYSKVTPLRLIPPEGSGSAEAIQIARALSASLEKLNQQIHKNSMDASAAVKLKGCTHPDKAPEAPELPPKKVSATSSLKPAVAKRSIDRLKKKEKENGVVGADNYVNLLRPLTIVDSVEDIHSDESGINMSFNNPLFLPKHSSTEEKASSTKTKRNSLSSSEMDGNEAISSSGEDILSSKDSLNSIPSTKSERARCRKSEADVPEVGQLRPQRKLFENWVEYVDPSSGRLFYYNEQSRQRSWKPPRRRGSSSPTNQPEERDGDGDDPAEGGVRSRLHAVAEAARNRTLPPVPAGWNESIDPYTEEVFYTSSATGARWYTSLDAKGRIYFYEEDSNESVWALPHITPAPPTFNDAVVEGIQLKGVYYPEGSKLSPSMNAPSRSVIPIVGPPKWDVLRQKSFKEVSKGDRQSKTRSMVLTNFSGCVEDVAVEAGGLVAGVAVAGVRTMTPMKTASLPRRIDIVYGTEAPQWPTLQAGSIRVLQQGVLQKTKLTDNSKKSRKNWTSSWVVLTDLFLFIFKESTSVKSRGSSTASADATNKPELCVDLNGTTIEWAAVKSKSSRKGVFQVSTLLGMNLLFQDEDETNAVVWFNEIKKAIKRLPCASKGLNSSPIAMRSTMNSAASNGSSGSSGNWLTPPSPSGRYLSSNSPTAPSKQQSLKHSRLYRMKSTKVNFLSSSEDLIQSIYNSPVERQVNLRDKLLNLFKRRPSIEYLRKTGIFKDEPVFGCFLAKLCSADESTVPIFVQKVIQIIESKAENMKADGIYRASGNLSQIQKIRYQVDQYNWKVLEIEEDVHVLTGCLKLFFRELKEPLIPFHLFDEMLRVTYVKSAVEKTRKYREIVKSLPLENYDTLKYLLEHLLKITEFRLQNRMHVSNLAIVFGPTLMWAATESSNLAMDMLQQNIVIEALLKEFPAIFR